MEKMHRRVVRVVTNLRVGPIKEAGVTMLKEVQFRRGWGNTNTTFRIIGGFRKVTGRCHSRQLVLLPLGLEVRRNKLQETIRRNSELI